MNILKTENKRANSGIATALAMTKEAKKIRAKKGANARWDVTIPIATHGDDDHPVKIGDVIIPCYVLSDGRRVLTQKGIASAIGSGGTSGKALSYFTQGKWISEFLKKETLDQIDTPIKFRTPTGSLAHGYEATILAEICEAVLSARKSGNLLKIQKPVADQCEILMRGFARVGIIALVDEATGYQKDRTKNALAQILEAFIAKELQPYVSKFPLEFYENMFRLRGLDFDPSSVKRPSYFGCLTNNIVYKRLAPGVLDELKKKKNKLKKEEGKQVHLHRYLTPDIGNPNLNKLITKVVTVMQLSSRWKDFKEKLDKIVPVYDIDSVEELMEDDGHEL
jgi:hypothetical protein